MFLDSDKEYGFLVKSCGALLLIVLSATLAMVSPLTTPFACGALGALFGLITRYFVSRAPDDSATLPIIFCDLRVRKFSSIGLASLLNSICFGGFLGTSSAYLMLGIIEPLKYISANNETVPPLVALQSSTYLALSLASLGMIIATRVIIESYVLLFRVGQKYLHDEYGREPRE
jgi:hypothetical protein